MNVLNNVLEERNTEGWERLQVVNGIINGTDTDMQ